MFPTDELTDEQHAALIREGREWLIECFGDQEDEIVEAPDLTIEREVERHYDGGWSAFVATTLSNQPA